MSVKLTDAQLVMMSAAAQRKDRCLSAPATIKGAALSKVSAKLAKLGLAREIEAKPGAPIWRRDDAGQGYALKLTAAGLKAIAVDEGSQDAIEPSEAPQPQAKNGASPDEGGHPARVAAPRDGSKLALVIEHLQRADGATIVDLTQATGWLPHTTRAALRVELHAELGERGARGLAYGAVVHEPRRADEAVEGDVLGDRHFREERQVLPDHRHALAAGELRRRRRDALAEIVGARAGHRLVDAGDSPFRVPSAIMFQTSLASFPDISLLAARRLKTKS